MTEDSNGKAVEPIPNKKSADRRSSIYDCAAMQGNALPQASLIKGRFGGIINIVEDTSPPPATIKKRGNHERISSMVGHCIEISNRFIEDYKRVIQCIEYILLRSNARQSPCHKPPLSKGGLEGL